MKSLSIKDYRIKLNALVLLLALIYEQEFEQIFFSSNL